MGPDGGRYSAQTGLFSTPVKVDYDSRQCNCRTFSRSCVSAAGNSFSGMAIVGGNCTVDMERAGRARRHLDVLPTRCDAEEDSRDAAGGPCRRQRVLVLDQWLGGCRAGWTQTGPHADRIVCGLSGPGIASAAGDEPGCCIGLVFRDREFLAHGQRPRRVSA